MLEIKHLSKSYGAIEALKNLNLTVSRGQILGLIGQNGAGKSTAFRTVLGLLEENTGEVLWDGRPLKKLSRDKIGFLPEERGVYPKMPIKKQLHFFADIKGMSKEDFNIEADYWLARFDLTDRIKSKVSTLSKGNQQKLQLISSFIHKPELLILDEPFSGLDPINADLLKQAVVEMKERGTAIIFSSHRMDHVEDICDRICLLKQGDTLFSGSLYELKQKVGRRKLTISKTLDKESLSAFPGILRMEEHVDRYIVLLEKEEDACAIQDAMDAGERYRQFDLDFFSLEEIFKMEVAQ